MSAITTHVLDTSRGVPAAGVAVILSVEDAEGWSELSRGETDGDGRVGDLLDAGQAVPGGHYRIRFETGAYFAGLGVESFYPYTEVVFRVAEGERYHVPLLLNPFGYSTYRGS